MKADKNTLKAIEIYLKQDEGLDEAIDDMVRETGLIKNKIMGELFTDECGIEWGGECICVLDEFIDKYTEVFINRICSVLHSFEEDDLSYYLMEE